MKLAISIAILLFCQVAFGQRILNKLENNKDFEWLVDSSSTQFTFYYEAGSWTSFNLELVKEKMQGRMESTLSFIGVESYNARIYMFIVESRSRMKDLIGRETNGIAFYKDNAIAGIASQDKRSLFSTHELFHVIAMNLWGVPENWINEGMAVYSSGKWHGYDLYQLTKYLVDTNRYVSLNELIKKFNKVDDLISYPLTGSFVKFLDETYGLEKVIEIWQSKSNKLEVITGKSIEELENDWLMKVQEIDYEGIDY